MTPERKQIYKFIEQNPDSTIKEVVEALKLSQSQCYKFLRSDIFLKTKVNLPHTRYYIFRINNRQVVANHNVPRHHELHQAFWGR